MIKIKIQILVLWLVTMCVSVSVYADGLGYVADYNRKGSILTVTFSNGKMKITPCSNDIFKITIEPNGVVVNPSNKVAMSPRQVNYDVYDNEDNIVLKLFNGNEVSLQKHSSQLLIEFEGGKLSVENECGTHKDAGIVIRLGRRNGELLYRYNEHGVLRELDGCSVTSFFSSSGWGVYFDGEVATLQLFPDVVECGISGGKSVTLYLMVSEHGNMVGVVKNYAELVGRSELIPFVELRDTVKKYCTAIQVASDEEKELDSDAWLPYNYTLAYEMAESGVPFVMPPCSYDRENGSVSSNAVDEYLWGRNVLVVSESGVGKNTHDVYIPCGKWHSWENPSISFEGPLKTESESRLLVKAGAFIPILDKTSKMKEYDPSQFLIRYFTGVKKSEYSLFDDDRKSTNTIKNNKHQLIDFVARENDDYLAISLDSRGWGYMEMPDERIFTFELIAMEQAPKKVMWGSNEMQAVNSVEELTADTYYYDSLTHSLWAKVKWNYDPIMLSIEK